MFSKISTETIQRIFVLASASLLFSAAPWRAAADDGGGHGGSFVYVMSNQSAGNSILVFQRAPDGSLAEVQEVPTQGNGTGGDSDPLGSQGALTLSRDGRLLLAVNAGSDEVTSLAVTATGLQFVSKTGSGGTMPVSVAVRDDMAYVVNAGGTPGVTAFQIDVRGALTMVPNSTMPLPGGSSSGPAQVGISPDGDVLIVTEKNTNTIDLFPIGDNGLLLTPSTAPSQGAVPFGFGFGIRGALVVSEAGNSTISSYRIGGDEEQPTLQPVTSSLSDSGAAACWLIVNRSGQLAYVSNSGTSTISSVAVAPDGSLRLRAAVAANTGSGTAPIDSALTRDGRFLYVISTSNGMLVGFRVQNGQLSPAASVAGLPLSIQGVAAR